MDSQLLLFAEQVYVSKKSKKLSSAQSQVFEGFAIAREDLCIVKQITLNIDGLSCLVKEL